MAFMGTAFGTVQNSYPNQMATALAGMLASGSDMNLCDSMPVLSTNGITVGRAAFKKAVAAATEASTSTVYISYSVAPTGNFTVGETVTETTSGATGTFVSNDAENSRVILTVASGTFTGGKTLTGGTSSVTVTGTTATLVAAVSTAGRAGAARSGVGSYGVISTADAITAGTCTAGNFAGVSVRTMAGFAGTTITPVWPLGAEAPIARPERAGCRIWVETSANDNIAAGDSVYIVTVLGTSPAADRAVGQFTNSATPDSNGTAILLAGSYFQSAGNKTAQKVEFTKVQAPSTLRTAVSKTATATLNQAEVTNTIVNAHHATVAIALTLPAAASGLAGCDALIASGGAAAVTVICAAGFGAAGSGGDTVTLAQGDMCHVYCDGTNWYVGNVTTAA